MKNKKTVIKIATLATALVFLLGLSTVLYACNPDGGGKTAVFDLDKATIRDFSDYVAIGGGYVNGSSSEAGTACKTGLSSPMFGAAKTAYAAGGEEGGETDGGDWTVVYTGSPKLIGLTGEGVYKTLTFETATTSANGEDPSQTETKIIDQTYYLSAIRAFEKWAYVSFNPSVPENVNTQVEDVTVLSHNGACLSYMLSLVNGKLYSLEAFSKLSFQTAGSANAFQTGEICLESDDALYVLGTMNGHTGYSLFRLSISGGDLKATEYLPAENLSVNATYDEFVNFYTGDVSDLETNGYWFMFADRYDNVFVSKGDRSRDSFSVYIISENSSGQIVREKVLDSSPAHDKGISLGMNNLAYEVSYSDGEPSSCRVFDENGGLQVSAFGFQNLPSIAVSNSADRLTVFRSQDLLCVSGNTSYYYLKNYKNLVKVTYGTGAEYSVQYVDLKDITTSISAQLICKNGGETEYRMYTYDTAAAKLYYFDLTETDGSAEGRVEVALPSNIETITAMKPDDMGGVLFKAETNVINETVNGQISSDGTVSTSVSARDTTVIYVKPLN